MSEELKTVLQEKLILCVSRRMAVNHSPIEVIHVTVNSEIKLIKLLYMVTRSSHTKNELDFIKLTAVIQFPLYDSSVLEKVVLCVILLVFPHTS